jgi:hypothetical protein
MDLNHGFVAPASRRRFRRANHANCGGFVLISVTALIWMAALTWMPAVAASAAQISSSGRDSDLATHAQPVGKPLSTIIEFGEQYETGDVPYLAKITVVKVLRGAPAEALVKAASPSNLPPKAGLEYLAAMVRFELSARVAGAHDEYTLDASQFTSISPDGSEYPAPKLAVQPSPAIHAIVKSGDSVEGWVVLQAPHADRTPLMLFVPDVGSTSHQGGSSIFRLYATASLGSSGKSS